MRLGFSQLEYRLGWVELARKLSVFDGESRSPGTGVGTHQHETVTVVGSRIARALLDCVREILLGLIVVVLVHLQRAEGFAGFGAVGKLLLEGFEFGADGVGWLRLTPKVG